METFIVRLWPEAGAIRGRVEHVATGRGETFRDAESLCGFLAGALDAEALPPSDDSLSSPGPIEV